MSEIRNIKLLQEKDDAGKNQITGIIVYYTSQVPDYFNVDSFEESGKFNIEVRKIMDVFEKQENLSIYEVMKSNKIQKIDLNSKDVMYDCFMEYTDTVGLYKDFPVAMDKKSFFSKLNEKLLNAKKMLCATFLGAMVFGTVLAGKQAVDELNNKITKEAFIDLGDKLSQTPIVSDIMYTTDSMNSQIKNDVSNLKQDLQEIFAKDKNFQDSLNNGIIAFRESNIENVVDEKSQEIYQASRDKVEEERIEQEKIDKALKVYYDKVYSEYKEEGYSICNYGYLPDVEYEEEPLYTTEMLDAEGITYDNAMAEGRFSFLIDHATADEKISLEEAKEKGNLELEDILNIKKEIIIRSAMSELANEDEKSVESIEIAARNKFDIIEAYYIVKGEEGFGFDFDDEITPGVEQLSEDANAAIDILAKENGFIKRSYNLEEINKEANETLIEYYNKKTITIDASTNQQKETNLTPEQVNEIIEKTDQIKEKEMQSAREAMSEADRIVSGVTPIAPAPTFETESEIGHSK